jgi:site-specific DNA-methyltransferase (adenine-specific)
MTVRILQGDCRDVLPTLPEGSMHSIVTDPPYGLGFMGKDWDHSVPGVEFWRAMLRVAKPGAHLLAFGGTRTFHRIVCAIEDAGWEIRDQIMWLYGSGFPKSKNLHDEWEGWGTALKPSYEPIIVARKPLIGTVAANMQAFATGALNIDACRIGESGARNNERVDYNKGRWPANVIHDGSEEVLAAFPQAPGQQGDLRQQDHPVPAGNAFGQYGPKREHVARIEADKSAARFFYCAKSSRKDRNSGCEDLPDRPGGMVSNTSGQHITRRDGGAPGPTKNNHPTVKPNALMRWLVRLVTPPGGTVLDPFAGSGSTGLAADQEGFDAILIEDKPEYVEIARCRISGDAPLLAEACRA